MRFFGLAALSGALAGLSATAFLWLLAEATRLRESFPHLIWGLPLAGFFIGWSYHHYGRSVAAGHELIVEEVRNPREPLPFILVPFVLVGTLLTHLFGGSAGREGTAVQMAAGLSDWVSRIFRLSSAERTTLLTIGAGAGFCAAIGAPWAGVAFGLEFAREREVRFNTFFERLVASFTAYLVTILLRAPHSVFPMLVVTFNLGAFASAIALGCLFGLAASGFLWLKFWIEKTQAQVSYPPLRPLLAGILLVLAFHLLGTNRYAGLGIPVIEEAFVGQSRSLDPFFKAVFTALTIGSGFKGGEFVPLVFIGTTLASLIANWLPIHFSLAAAVGFGAVYAGATLTPYACSLMVIELFGLDTAPYALIGCAASAYVARRFRPRK